MADRVAAQRDLANAQWNARAERRALQGGRHRRARSTKSSQQTVAAARARLAAAEARLRATATRRATRASLAPTSGVVEKRCVEPGEHVARGRVDVHHRAQPTCSSSRPPCRRGRPTRYASARSCTSSPTGASFDGRVARVSPTIDPATRAVTVYVQVPNAGGALRGGTFATGRVVSRTVNNVLAVPTARAAPVAGRRQPFVYRIDGRRSNVAPVQVGVVDERLGHRPDHRRAPGRRPRHRRQRRHARPRHAGHHRRRRTDRAGQAGAPQIRPAIAPWRHR